MKNTVEIELPKNARVANKYNRVVEAIRKKIVSGEYSGMLPGTKLLADEYGVSLMTADKAVKVLEKEKLVVRLPRKGTLICSSATKKTDTFALVVRDVSMPLTSRVIGEFGKMARNQGVQTLFFQHFDDVDKEAAIVREIAAGGRVDGVVMVLCSRRDRGVSVDKVTKAGIPVVVLDLAPSAEWPAACNVIAFDERRSFEDGTMQLLKLGHKRIAPVFPTCWDGLSLPVRYRENLRWQGYASAVEAVGLMPVPPVWFDSEKMMKQKEIEKFVKAIEPYTALFLHHDTFASVVVTALHRAGVRVPDDVSLLSYDGAPLSRDLDLATMELPMERVALRAAEILRGCGTGEIRCPVREIFSAKICLRGSMTSAG